MNIVTENHHTRSLLLTETHGFKGYTSHSSANIKSEQTVNVHEILYHVHEMFTVYLWKPSPTSSWKINK